MYQRELTNSECPLATMKGFENGMSNPANAIPEQMQAGGKLFLVGDSVIGQICQLGNPGLCCSPNRPCDGAPSYASADSPWEVALDQMAPYNTQGWQHLLQLKARAANNTAQNEVYFMAPEVHDEEESVPKSVALAVNFLREHGPSEKDVLVLGMLGNHYNHGLGAFNSYITGLIQQVVNPFPGRVILLGYSPQHFAGAGHYTAATRGAGCAPSPLPGEVDPPRNSFRSSIFLYNAWGQLTHTHARLVDYYEMLIPLWACHRAAGDCTHWHDNVITLQAQLILNALQAI